MSEREKLQQAIANLKTQRAILGDETVDTAIDGLRQKLAALTSDADQPPAAMDGERKIVTVMFADVAGFTAMSETMDPETVRDTMNACFEALVPIVQKYGGTVDKFIGDEIMALFGAPEAHENDPERALCAALEMMEKLAEFNAECDTDLGLHFGINTGLVLAGVIGTQSRQEYSVMGETVNLASRLEDASERGQIFVGPDTYRLTAPLFEFAALTPLPLKGKSEPVPVYRLLSAKAEPGSARGLESHGILSPLVGRYAESAAIKSCLAYLLEGQGGIVTILGEAGLGKSRLVTEVRQEVPAEQLTWLEGRSLSFGQKVGYWPFQDIVRDFVHITEEDSEAVAWNKLEQRVHLLFPDQVEEVLPYLASLLALNVRPEYEERVKYLDGEAMGRQIFLTMRRFFTRLTQDQPLVLVFEDIHWADEASVALIEHLLPLVERAPLLIGLVSRPDPTCPAARLQTLAAQEYADHYTEIHLTPLSDADSEQLVHNLLAIENLPARVQRVILSKAEGNPFFVEEVIRSLIDMNAIVHDAETDQWRATERIEHVTIPDTIHGVVMARIDRLEEDVKRVLRRAAVIGRTFLYRILRALSQADSALDRHLAELQHLEMIREKQQTPELEYIFKHALAHEATYQSILIRRRRELHVQVGECIETLFAGRLEEFYGLLAYHYAQAEEWEKAQDYLFKAGDQAGQLAADAEALTYYQKAMAAYERVFGDKWEPIERAQLERKLGEVLFRRGEHEQAIKHLHRALSFLGKPLSTSPWAVYMDIFKQVAQQISHRLLPAILINRTAKTDPILHEQLHIYAVMAWINFFLDQKRFLLSSITGLNLSERKGYLFGMTQGYMAIGTICDVIPLFRIAGYYHQRAVDLARKIQQSQILGLAYHGLAYHEYCLGEWEDALVHYQNSASAYWEAGNLRGWGIATTMSDRLLCGKENIMHSLSRNQKQIQVGENSADPQLLAWGLNGKGYALLRLGRLDEAVADLQRALKLHKSILTYQYVIMAGSDLGECYLQQDKLEKALQILEECNRTVAEKGLRDYSVTWPRNNLAEAYLIAVEQASEEHEKNRWLKKAKHACALAIKHGKKFRVGLPKARRLKGRYEWLRGRHKAAQKWWLQSLDVAEELGSKYDSAMAHLEIGKYQQERAHLEQAEAIFDDIGAKLDLARARDLLA